MNVSYTVTTRAGSEFSHDFNYVSVIDSHYEDGESVLVIDVEVDESDAPRYEHELSNDAAVISYRAA